MGTLPTAVLSVYCTTTGARFTSQSMEICIVLHQFTSRWKQSILRSKTFFLILTRVYALAKVLFLFSLLYTLPQASYVEFKENFTEVRIACNRRD